MAPKDVFTPQERDELRKNEAVDFLLSRLNVGEKIERRTQLRSRIRGWLTSINQHAEVPSRVPEFLFRVLINFAAPGKAKEIQDIEVPEESTASEQWLVKVRALMAEQADERLLALLDSLPERIVWCDDLVPNQEERQPSPRKLRGMMRENDREAESSSASLPRLRSGARLRRAPQLDPEHPDQAEQRRLLEQIFGEVKALKKMLADAKQGQMEAQAALPHPPETQYLVQNSGVPAEEWPQWEDEGDLQQ